MLRHILFVSALQFGSIIKYPPAKAYQFLKRSQWWSTEKIRTHQNLAQEVIIFLGKKLLQAHEMMIGLISGKVEKRKCVCLLPRHCTLLSTKPISRNFYQTIEGLHKLLLLSVRQHTTARVL